MGSERSGQHPVNTADLGDFYERNRRYFWFVFATCQLAYFLLWLVLGGSQASVGQQATWLDWIRILGPLEAFVLLAVLRRPLIDYALPLLLIGFYGWLYWPQTLGS